MPPAAKMSSLAVSPKHSTLELVKYDATAQAPGWDNAAVASGSNNEFDALQVRCSLIKENFPSNMHRR